MHYPDPPNAEVLRQLYEGLTLFNRQRFWEAHEAWEEAWKALPPVCRLFFQGLIQVAAGLHQLRRGIYHGAVKHLRNARWKLALFPDDYLDLDVGRLKNDIEKVLRALECGGRQAMPRMTAMELFPILTTTQNAALSKAMEEQHGQ